MTSSAGRPASDGRADDAPVNGGRMDGAYDGTEVEEISLLRLLNVLLRHRRALAVASLGTAFLFVTVSLLFPREYTSRVSFLPQVSEGSLSRLAGLAAQFGVSIPGQSAARSPEFYADLLRSRDLLQSAVTTRYALPPSETGGEARRVDLVEYYGISERSREEAVVEAEERLRESLSISTRGETGVVRFDVTTTHPELSRAVAARLLELVQTFNLETRQSEASVERAFIGERLQDVEAELREAEARLERFLEQNRRYDNVPNLQFEYERLQRQVGLHQQVHASLAQAYETAKVEEVRNTPVITVVDPPDLPVRPDSRQLPLKGLLGLTLGLVGGIAWAFGREIFTNARTYDPEYYEEFARLRRESKEDLERLLSLVGKKGQEVGAGQEET